MVLGGSNDSRGMRTPFVYWAQDKEAINLKVDIRYAKGVEVSVAAEGRLVLFSAVGQSSGPEASVYVFHLPLNGAVEEIPRSVKSSESNVEIQLVKKERPAFWKNGLLSLDAQKQAHKWLKFDFERWQDDPDEEHLDAEQQQLGSERNEYLERMLKELERENRATVMSEEELLRRMNLVYNSYLFCYNLAMFVINFFILCSILFKFVSTPRVKFMADFWSSYVSYFFVANAFQYLDVLHSLVGITKAGYKAALMQVTGRLFVLMIVNGQPSMWNWQPVFSLMLTYLLSEQFRYPYYALNTIGISIPPLIWLRYNMWIILYPVGLLLEGLILFASVPHYYSSGTYSLSMPNALNMSFNFGIFLALFGVTCFPVIGYNLLTHMYRQRKAKMAEMYRDAAKKKKH